MLVMLYIYIYISIQCTLAHARSPGGVGGLATSGGSGASGSHAYPDAERVGSREMCSGIIRLDNGGLVPTVVNMGRGVSWSGWCGGHLLAIERHVCCSACLLAVARGGMRLNSNIMIHICIK